MNFTIRKADSKDAFGIHSAHILSIQEVCSRDHSSEEVAAWGHRPFIKEQRLKAINEQIVYVVIIDEVIEGFVHANIDNGAMYVFALYITNKALGLGIGRKMMDLLFLECQQQNVTEINLHSTITAHSFYLKLGFVDSAPMTTVIVNNAPVRCTPMKLKFADAKPKDES